MISSYCSSLIDVLKYAHYNIVMEESALINLLDIETAKPKRQITRSVGAIYIALIVLIIGCISIGNLLYQHYQIPRFLTQPVLYCIIAICGYYLYKRHYICFRYTLTDELFVIEQTGGNKEKTIAVIQLCEIKRIDSAETANKTRGKLIHTSLPPRKDATYITINATDREMIYTISATVEMVGKLKEAWKAAI